MAALLGLTLVVLLVHDLPLVSYLKTVESDRIITALERDSFVIAGKSEDQLHVEENSNEPKFDLTAELDEYAARTGARIIVTDAVGVVVASSDEEANIGASYLSRPEVAAALAGEISNGRRYSNSLGYELFYVAVPVLSGADVLGTVRITYPSDTVDVAIAERMRGILTVAGITLLLAGVVAWIMATSVTRRLKSLKETTESFAKGDLSTRAMTTEGAPEIRQLGESFNVMADQIERLINQQRAFAGDASHQLRTPLTALSLRLERARDLIASDRAAAAERLESALDEAERLQRLVEGLLLLSRSEAKTSADLAVFDAAAVARDRFEHWQALAGEQMVTLDCQVPERALVECVPTALEQIFDNFIDNALGICPPNSTITLSINRVGQNYVLHVLDEGPGLPTVDLDRALNRFWRAKSDASGTGLGLAIVDRLAQASGGRAVLYNRTPHGLDATVELKARD
jgi:signal transduction histidine kinase